MLSLKSKITRLVLGYFYEHETAELFVNELARRLELDSGNLARKLVQLEHQGVFKSRWRGEQRFYSLNKAFPLYKEYKKIIKRTAGIEAMLKHVLGKINGVTRAVLFGSYAQNTMDAVSDIDILVIGRHDTLDLQRGIAAVQRRIEREINVISISPEEFIRRKKTDPFLMSIESKKAIRLV